MSKNTIHPIQPVTAKHTQKSTHLPIYLQGESDALFSKPGYPKPFEFNAEVANCFDNMAVRSIPLYEEVTRTAAVWAKHYYIPGTHIVDIGCSTGTTLELIARVFRELDIPAKFLAIDTSAPMLEHCRQKLDQYKPFHDFTYAHQDVSEIALPSSSVIISNYTLQFIPVARRSALLHKIYASLQERGIFFLSDKLRAAAPDIHETITHIYENFKFNNGYSRNEIERKKEALDHVLIPYTLEEELALLNSAGFLTSEVIMKWHQFATFVALKS